MTGSIAFGFYLDGGAMRRKSERKSSDAFAGIDTAAHFSVAFSAHLNMREGESGLS
jgi:hypothetical protein